MYYLINIVLYIYIHTHICLIYIGQYFYPKKFNYNILFAISISKNSIQNILSKISIWGEIGNFSELFNLRLFRSGLLNQVINEKNWEQLFTVIKSEISNAMSKIARVIMYCAKWGYTFESQSRYLYYYYWQRYLTIYFIFRKVDENFLRYQYFKKGQLITFL